MKIKNPILKGFNPDPSICRVGDDYYIATSTFEWFPGVQIHHSKDLINWKLITRPLSRISQLNMKGNPNSGGIWAPCLSYSDGIFYLIYTDVKTSKSSGIFKDSHNYLVTSEDITGEWSEPVYLNSSGFDPSLFHDDDGKKWLLNMLWDFRTRKKSFGGILLQEYDPVKKKLTGPVKNIFKGTEIDITEGSHLYKKNGYYYLLTAEGGTYLEHAVTMARSKNIDGPYEVDPENPILTSHTDPENYLQRSGHASLVETKDGQWYMAHLCGRPLPSRGRCIMGRETSIQKMKWTEDGWIRLMQGGRHPFTEIPSPGIKLHAWPKEPGRDDFDSEVLNIHFQSLRIPLDDTLMSLSERPGFLRLKGAESLSSNNRQALIARRQQAFHYTASTCIEFEPEHFQQMAGLICIYDSENYFYLHVTHDEKFGKYINILNCDNGKYSEPLFNIEDLIVNKNFSVVSINDWEKCYLKVEIKFDKLQFYYSKEGKDWLKIGEVFDASKISDEYYDFINEQRFTGAFVGLCCQDLSGKCKSADFDFFEYIEYDD